MASPNRRSTAKTQRIEPGAVSLELPPLVRSGVLFLLLSFFISLRGLGSLFFCCVFRPFPKVGIPNCIDTVPLFKFQQQAVSSYNI